MRSNRGPRIVRPVTRLKDCGVTYPLPRTEKIEPRALDRGSRYVLDGGRDAARGLINCWPRIKRRRVFEVQRVKAAGKKKGPHQGGPDWWSG